YNTFVGSGVRFECSQNRSAQMYGNIVGGLGSFECGSWKAVQHHNIADSGQAVAACGTGSYVAPDGQIDMVNRAAGNYHLTATSEAVNRGDAANRPSTDIDGDARPRGAAPDAGA